ncbi:response regulator [Bradyrhizobium sp. SZCCHNRI1009]|uniref:response regulator n=1 Tax=Bradyrhizobium TaxID=374 RepID=UPI002916F812|nr:response regulator [Bradyrhizobium sp. SZCCHNRI1009]
MSNQLLVIEDAEVHLSILRKIAAQCGYEATCVTSVEAAADLLRRRTFDCITLDLSLGDRCGADILLLLNELKSRTPVIFISGAEDATRDEHVRLGTVLGLVVYPQFQKPVDLPALRETLKQIATLAECERLVAAVR